MEITEEHDASGCRSRPQSACQRQFVMGGSKCNDPSKGSIAGISLKLAGYRAADALRNDVATYFAARPGGLPAVTGLRVPEGDRSLRQSNPAIRLVFAGDPARGIAPCSACHGPGGYKLGAPALQQQRTTYIESQLLAFAQHAPERHQRADAHDRHATDTGRDACRRRLLRGGGRRCANDTEVKRSRDGL
jgi:mono/diheme cytochrome c family protein